MCIRTVHRSLEHCRQVNVVEDREGRVIWLLFARDVVTELWDTHAGGREIQVLPDHDLPPVSMSSMRFREDPLPPINCRRILRTDELRTLRDYFPGSVGVRTLVSGFLFVLFDDKKSMKRCWELGSLESIGGQRPGYLVTHYEKTSDQVTTGYARHR